MKLSTMLALSITATAPFVIATGHVGWVLLMTPFVFLVLLGFKLLALLIEAFDANTRR